MKYPIKGWTYEGMEDNLSADKCKCAVCGKAVRFAHYISHPEVGEICVGCKCADNLTGSTAASDREAMKVSANGKLKRLCNKDNWLCASDTYSLSYEGYKIRIKQGAQYYSLSVEFVVTHSNGFMELNEVKTINSKYYYKTFQSAVERAFWYISNGKMEKYRNNQRKLINL